MTAVAITTMVKGLDHTFRDWCQYHLQAVDRIFVWLDDMREIESPYLLRDRRVQIRAGSQHRQGSVHGDFMVRQDQNTQRSLSLCIHEHIDWLIHLDRDELLFPADPGVLRRNLPIHAGHVTLLNHEVCPAWHSDDPFRECHFFRLNGRSPFWLYSNGKAAVRCQPGVHPRDAHSFVGYSGDESTAAEVVVLHYACPTYDHWLAKYAALGDFPDFWWDNPQCRITLPFHLRSRDICKQCSRTRNFRPALDFWAAHIDTPQKLKAMQDARMVGWFAPMGTRV